MCVGKSFHVSGACEIRVLCFCLVSLLRAVSLPVVRAEMCSHASEWKMSQLDSLFESSALFSF